VRAGIEGGEPQKQVGQDRLLEAQVVAMRIQGFRLAGIAEAHADGLGYAVAGAGHAVAGLGDAVAGRGDATDAPGGHDHQQG
ncbi:hypothetical protein DF186_22435, partial [Enterococcus hirae]